MTHHEPASDQDHPAEEHADDHHEPPPPEEPRTPTWLTVVGVSLFVVAGIWFLGTRPAARTIEELRPAPASSGSAAASAVAPAAKPGVPGMPNLAGAPAGSLRPNLPAMRPRPTPPPGH